MRAELRSENGHGGAGKEELRKKELKDLKEWVHKLIMGIEWTNVDDDVFLNSIRNIKLSLLDEPKELFESNIQESNAESKLRC